jgi:prefoldin subunit 5
MPEIIEIPVSPGEIIDKITILEIKADRVEDGKKLINIRRELELLADKVNANLPMDRLFDLKSELKSVNEKLWEIEDDIRTCERHSDFGETFVQLARSVYITNDRRAILKKEINMLLGSEIVEEKSYDEY